MAFTEDTDDLATLSRLDEQVLVDQLHRRYDADKIYVSLVSLWGACQSACSALISLQITNGRTFRGSKFSLAGVDVLKSPH
jgi:hypothetical protein